MDVHEAQTAAAAKRAAALAKAKVLREEQGGVGVTVSAVMITIFLAFAGRNDP